MFDHYYKGVAYSRPEFLYFWFYYFFMNFIWMIFPGSKWRSACWQTSANKILLPVLLVSSVRTIAKAFTALEQTNNALKRNGTAKKAN